MELTMLKNTLREVYANTRQRLTLGLVDRHGPGRNDRELPTTQLEWGVAIRITNQINSRDKHLTSSKSPAQDAPSRAESTEQVSRRRGV